MGYTLSVRQANQVNKSHNRRDNETVSRQNKKDVEEGLEAHIDPNGRYEVLIDKSQTEALHELLDGAIEDYNRKQKRKDRKTSYEKVIGTFLGKPNTQIEYETIITVGNQSDRPNDEECERLLKAAYRTFQAANPNLKITGAYIHFDEPGAAPHLHIDYIPWHHKRENGRGVDVQLGMKGALEEMGYTNEKGFGTKEARQEGARAQFSAKMREIMKEMVENRGIEVVPGQSKGKAHKDPSMHKKEEMAEKVKKKVSKEIESTYNLMMLKMLLEDKDIKQQYLDLVEDYRDVAEEILENEYKEIDNGMTKE